MPPHSRRLGLCLAFVFALVPLLSAGGGPAKAPPKMAYYKGKVVPLADLAARAGAKLDTDAAPYWLALVTEEGKVYPLFKDSGSRMFFKDKALHNRLMRLRGRLLPGSGVLQVVAVNSYRDGRLHEIYYWCDICSIRRSEKNICECCGGPMELHEDPIKE